MKIHLKKGSRVSVVDQLVGQIEFLIATGEIRGGDALPTLGELAKRFRLHKHTMAPAYAILKERGCVEGRRGSKMIVRDLEESDTESIVGELDDLISDFVVEARRRGYSAQQLRLRVQNPQITSWSSPSKRA